MQASQSGLWVYVAHDNADGTNLRLQEAKEFQAGLNAAIAQTEAAHAEAHHPVGRDVSGAEVVVAVDEGAKPAPPAKESESPKKATPRKRSSTTKKKA